MSQAAHIYKQIIRSAPNSAEAHDLLGVALSQLGFHEEAIANLRRAAKLNSRLPGPRINLPQALLKAGRLDDAILLFRKLIREDSRNERAVVGLAQALLSADRDQEAISVMEKASPFMEKSASFLNERGRLASKLGTHGIAAADYRKAIRLAPQLISASVNLGNALVELRQYAEAVSVFEGVLHNKPNDLAAITGLASALRIQRATEEAIAVARRGLKHFPGDPGLMNLIARFLIDLGRNDEAEKILRQVIEKGPGAPMALETLAPIHKFRKGDADLPLVEKLLLQSTDRERRQARKALLFVKSKIHDDIGEHREAVATAIEAKSINPLRNLIGESRDFFTQVLRPLNTAFFEARRNIGNPSEQPVFILGMPRSGTSLTEQIIASHDLADGAGEMVKMPDIRKSLGIREDGFMPTYTMPSAIDSNTAAALAEDYLVTLRANRKPNALRITDKLPHNFQNIWLIALLFPNARIIHCKRNPVDTCMSIFLRNFGDGHWYTRDLETLGKFYKLYEEQVAHWKAVTGLKWYDNDYEQLVADPEPNIRRMIDFLGLPWDEKCLSHTETERSVMTFSRWQVRQPIYKTSVEKWRKYAPYIGPLLKELGIEAS